MNEAPNNVATWFEIPATDLQAAQRFYETVLGTTMTRQDAGPNPAVFFSNPEALGVSGHLYPGKPATSGTGPTIHLTVNDSLEASVARVSEAGGKVISDIIALPVGRFVYCEDLDSNSFALFAATS